MTTAEKLVLACLIGAAISLLIVGAVTGLVIRHIIQILPLAVAAVLVARRQPSSPYAAAPLFIFWAFLMLNIWLFLLGIARVITGHFTPIEVLLTMIIGGASFIGLAAALACKLPARWNRRIATFVIFALFQLAALWTSVQPAIQYR